MSRLNPTVGVLLALLAGCGESPGDTTAAPEPQALTPAEHFAARCAHCHQGGVPRAPHMVTFQLLGSEAILESITTGLMAEHAAGLTTEERAALAAHLGGGAPERVPPVACTGADAAFDPAEGVPLRGWGFTPASTRFVPAALAGLSPADVPGLELAWAFAYSGATRARSQPTYAFGAVYVGSQHGDVYALDLETGCVRWSFRADAEVRNAVTIADPDAAGNAYAYFGDIRGTVYRVDALTGTPGWKVRAHDHANVTLTGSPRLHGDRLYVPLSSSEWASAADPGYPCCTFRGGVVAMAAATGEIQWTSYSIPDAPRPTGAKNASGAARYHPAGAPVWNSPTLDVKRNRLYVGTGEAYTSPAAPTSDSVLAIDLDTGHLDWWFQATAGDAWNMACFIGGGENCPEEDGPDLDFGAPPVLVTLPEGKDVLIAGQKSGDVYGLDPDANGALLWHTKIGRGGFAGGVHWGLAAGEGRVYAPNADTIFTGRFTGERKPGLFALDPATGEILWFTPAPDVCPEAARPACDPGLSAPPTAIPGVVFAGAFDGHLRAYDAATGATLWDYDTNREFVTLSGERAHGGSIEADGPLVVRGHVLVNSGYLFGDRMAGNVLLAFRRP